MTETTITLRRTLTSRDLILLSIVAGFAPESIPLTLALGAYGLPIWLLATVIFRLPYLLALIHLSASYPQEGGIYAWTRMAFGDFHGFLCGWSYWVQNLFYLPTVFIGLVTIVMLLGRDKVVWLSRNPLTIGLFACAIMWLLTILQVVGLNVGKWLQNVGGFFRLSFVAILVVAAFWRLSFNSFSSPQVHISLGLVQYLALWPFVLNGLAGLEVSPVMNEEAYAPTRRMPRALLIGGVVATLCSLVTYTTILSIGVNPANVIYGHMEAITSVINQSAGRSWAFWLLLIVIVVEVGGRLGTGATWLGGPARIPFVIGLDRYLPPSFGRIHPLFRTPYFALVFQAVIVMTLILINTLGVTIQEAYVTLLAACLVLYLVTYAYLLASWLKLSVLTGRASTELEVGDRKGHPIRLRGIAVLAVLGLLGITLAIVACFIPSQSIENRGWFEIKMLGFIASMLVSGIAIYRLMLNSNRKVKR